jgi:16S rRNA (guanine527-N7)-methyltransferase
MTPVEVRLLQAAARELGVDVGHGAVDRLARFLDLLEVWNRRIHLTGARGLARLVRDHAIDSLAPAPHIPRTGLVVDVGSGAGFPGIVLACLRPDLEMALIESRRRRASFLREAIRTLPLPAARVFEMRAEEAATDPQLAGRAAVAISRALRLDIFLSLAVPLLAPHGTAIAMQTPRTAGLARERAFEHGFRLAARQDYALPGGTARTLLFFEHGPPVS